MQFSLKSIIFAVVIVAVMCSFFFAWPEDVSIYVPITGLTSLLVSFLVGVIVFDNAHGRAFAIGALACFLFISIYLFVFSLYALDWEDFRAYKLRVGLITMLIPFGGLTGLFALWSSVSDNADAQNTETNKIRLSPTIVGLIFGMLLAGAIGFTGTYVGHDATTPDAPMRINGGIIAP